MRRLIQIEFNELSPVLIDEFIAAGELPNFKRLRDSSEVFVSDASDEISLEPWVQWPSLHTGIQDREHGIEHLGEAHKVAGRGIARVAAEAGLKVGVFGSMNMDYGPLDGFVVPDPWNPDSAPYPKSLSGFTNFVASAVQENSVDKLDKRAALPFLAFVATHGLTFSTGLRALRQLIQERRDPGLTWRRSLVLDAISYDVFRKLVRHHDVDYATFFSNSTAHFQHYYWRNFRPEEFEISSPPDDHPSLAGAVLEGYRNHDRLLGRFLSDFSTDRLVLVTGLSQESWDTTMCTYRPRDFGRLMSLIGIDDSQVVVEPVMAERFFLSFPSEQSAQDAARHLMACKLGGQPLFYVEQTEPLRLKTGCAINEWSAADMAISLPSGDVFQLDELFSRVHSLRSGRHNPDGCFWIQSDAPRRHAEKIPVTAIAPTILRALGIDSPEYMKESAAELSAM